MPQRASLKGLLARLPGRSETLVPVTRRSRNVYLVEYPKSGITWLSQALANALLIDAGRKDRATFASVRSYIPDLNVSTDLDLLGYADDVG